MITLTLDTSCINAKGKNKALNELEALQNKGLIHLVSTTSVEEELLQPDKEPYRTQRLDKFSEYEEVDVGYWVLDYSRLGISTKLGSESTKEEMHKIASILFPYRAWSSLTSKQIRDVMVMHTHFTNNRDIFVTLNIKDFIGKNRTKQKRLNQQFGICVMTPSEALKHVQTSINLNHS